jgi:RNA polymerase-binding transcription factor DksA
MASQRKTASRNRAAKPAAKARPAAARAAATRHARPATKARPGSAAPAKTPPRPVRGAPAKASPVKAGQLKAGQAKAGAAKASPVKPGQVKAGAATASQVKAGQAAASKGKGVRPVAVATPAGKKKVAVAPPPASKKAPVRLKAVPRPPMPGPEVRPLGVLPPESRARGLERSTHGSVGMARAAAPVVTGRAAGLVPKAVAASDAGTGKGAIAGGRARSGGATKNQGAQGVTDKDMKEFEERLLLERQRLMKEMGHLESTVLKVNPRDSAGDLSGYSFHMADAGTDAYEREKAFQFASAEGRLLMDINEALRRLYRGEYGTCESCSKMIAKARLEAMPTARLCRDCKEKEERENRPQQ